MQREMPKMFVCWGKGGRELNSVSLRVNLRVCVFQKFIWFTIWIRVLLLL